MSSANRGQSGPNRMWRARIVIADADPEVRAWLRDSLEELHEITEVESRAQTLRTLVEWPPHVLIVGHALTDVSGAQLLAEVRQLDKRGRLSLFVAEPEPGKHLPPEDESVFYVLNRSCSKDDIQALIGSAIARHAPRPVTQQPSGPVSNRDQAVRLARVLEAARRLATQRDLAGASRAAVLAVLELIGADRASCLFYDADSGALWAEGEPGAGGEEREATATSGLAGFAARTSTQVCLERVGSDSRYDRRVDDPEGKGDERFLVQPIVGPDGQVHAVLVAVRDPNREPFSKAAREVMELLAEQTGPLLHQLALQVEAESVLEEAAEAEGGDRELFRREALEARIAHTKHGDVVRISPRWVRWSYWIMVVILIAAGVYLGVGTVDEYSSGIAVVRMSGRTEVTAKRAGTIVSIEVEPGQHVAAGQLLARFYDVEEAAELDRLEDEFEMQLVKFLRHPEDEAVKRDLSSLRTQIERAKGRLEEQTARAPHAGTVSDLRTRAGQHLVPGDVILSIVGAETSLSLIALMPGSDRPQLRPGQKLRLSLAGYRGAYQDLRVEAVSDDLVGPMEARRYLGSQIADTVPIAGPVALIRVRLPSPTFEADGRVYSYHDGMQGLAEVRVRSQPIILALIPGLRDVL